MNANEKQIETIKSLLAGELLGHRRAGQNVVDVKFRQLENGKIGVSVFYEWFVTPGLFTVIIGKRGGMKVL
jgi:hypothetical protein